MRKKNISFIILPILLILLSFLLIINVGCSKGKETYSGTDLGYGINLSVIYCDRQNSSAYPNIEKLGPYIMSALKIDNDNENKNNQINLVSCDGKPTSKTSIYKPSTKNLPENVISENQENTINIIKEIAENRAFNNECDIYEAINVANDQFDNNNKNQNIIIICDSGISTKGIINYQNSNTLSANAQDYESSHKLTNLSKTDRVIWFGHNQVAEPQDRMPSQIRDYSKNLLKDILIKSKVGTNLKQKNGGEEFLNEHPDDIIEFLACDNKTVFAEDLPDVTVVTFPEVDFSNNYTAFEKGESNKLIFPEYQIQFIPDTANFINPVEASDILSNVAQILKNNSTMNITINGYISSDGPETGNLSQLRADTIKQMLINLGAEGNRITSIGKGPGPYPYIKDGIRNAENRFIEILRNN